VATAWWTAHRAHWTSEKLALNDRRFVYLVQDYEPSFYGGSDVQALASWTYRMPCLPVVNCTTLAAHLRRLTLLPVDDALVLAPQVDIDVLAARPRMTSMDGPLRVLAYGRPSVPRNLFETAIRGLALWVSQRSSDRSVEIVTAGEAHGEVDLGRGVVVRSLGQLAWDRYLDELALSHIGLSLMLSPHPSYPPLEMAAAGLVVVTNHFGDKDLSMLTPRIVSCEPTSLDVARALTKAEGLLPDLDCNYRAFDISTLGARLDRVATVLRERLNH
jgi:O-antigen biosynthesis protein